MKDASLIYVRFFSEDDKLIGVQNFRINDLINTGGDPKWYMLEYEKRKAGQFLMQVKYQGPAGLGGPMPAASSGANVKAAMADAVHDDMAFGIPSASADGAAYGEPVMGAPVGGGLGGPSSFQQSAPAQ